MMAVIVMVSAKASPGATTAAAALAASWQGNVVLVGADPMGDDLLSGWLGPWVAGGWIHQGRGIVSFATQTRHAEPGRELDLQPHLQSVPEHPHCRVLVGLSEPAQETAVGVSGWQRLACALAAPGLGAVDVIVDGGRFGAATPWPLLEVADLVLVTVRPSRRSLLGARPATRLLQRQLPANKLGLAVVATTRSQSAEVIEVLGLPCGLQLPRDEVAAHVFSDGAEPGPRHRRSPLVRAASAAGARLHAALTAPPTTSAPDPGRPVGQAIAAIGRS